MADDSLTFAAGLVGGILVVLLLVAIIRANQQQSQGSNRPQMTSYNVVRDEQGRIQSVETLSGLPLEGQQPAREQSAAPAALRN